MVYGTESGVLLIVGGNTDYITTEMINLAITRADILVDKINSDASSLNKTLASEIIASDILLQGQVNKRMVGLSSDGGVEGRPGRTGPLKIKVSQEAKDLLLQPGISFATTGE